MPVVPVVPVVPVEPVVPVDPVVPVVLVEPVVPLVPVVPVVPLVPVDVPGTVPEGLTESIPVGIADSSFLQEAISNIANNEKKYKIKAIGLCPRPGLIIVVVKLIMPFERLFQGFSSMKIAIRN